MSRPHRPPPRRQYPRTARLSHLVHEIIAEELERIDDDDLELVTITNVAVEADMRHAVVRWTTLDAEHDEAVEVALARHRVALQRAIADQARLKRTPELTFEVDAVARGAEVVLDTLRHLEDDDSSPG